MSRISLCLASSLMVALPLRNWSCKAAMSACFFSSSAFLGANRACRSAGGLLPVLGAQNGVLDVDDRHLGRAAAPGREPARPCRSAKAGKTTNSSSSCKLLKCLDTNILRPALRLEGPADGEAERRCASRTRDTPARTDATDVEERLLVREDRTVRHDRRLQDIRCTISGL